MLKNRFLAVLTATVLTCSLCAQAESETVSASQAPDDNIIIEGDKLELHLDRKMRAIGNASIRRGTQDVLGDVIEYDVQNDELQATGNVRIDLGDASLTGPKLRMRLSESIGEIQNASIKITKPLSLRAKEAKTARYHLQDWQNITENATVTTESFTHNDDPQNSNGTASITLPPQSRGDAKTIFFEGQNKKRLKNARYTTCSADVDDWYIKAGELKLNDFTESGVAKNAHVEFKGVPLLYSPWISFSYANQRKSGLLAPTFGSTSKSGFELATPFYWNISPNMDATLATRVLSKRGVQFQGEFRYLEDNFSGVDSVEYLPNDNESNKNRFYANLRHQHNLGDGWSAGYGIERVSDDQYFSDMSTRIITTSRINLPQQANLSYTNDNWRFEALAQKFQTLDNKSYPYERLPQLTLNGAQYFGGIDTNLYTQLVAFNTNENAPVAVTGTRFTLYPSVSLPMNTSFGYVTPKVGLHHTNYSLNNIASNLESPSRDLPIFSLDSGVYFDKELKIANRNYSQTLEPRLFYVYIPNTDQSSIPVFDTNEADLNFSTLFRENQFTGNDRINNANQLSLALTTRLIESSTGTQRLSAAIGQRYYFADQKVTIPGATVRKSDSSDVIAGVTANLKTNWNADAFWQYNTDDSRSVRSTITSRYNPEPGKALNLSYSYRRDSINQFDLSAQWPIGQGWYGIGRVNYSLFDNHIIETLAGVEYNAGCWQTRTVIQRVSTATANANYALFFQLELGGLASIGANPLSVIKRSIPGYTSSGLIPDTYQ